MEQPIIYSHPRQEEPLILPFSTSPATNPEIIIIAKHCLFYHIIVGIFIKLVGCPDISGYSEYTLTVFQTRGITS